MRIKQVFRYSSSFNPLRHQIDGLPNFIHATNLPGEKKTLLEKGISPIAEVNHDGLSRTPAILLSSSPHKTGSVDTPWKDIFDLDNGHIKYFGDNKTPLKDPGESTGNKALLKQFSLYHSPDKHKRILACPILFFKRVSINGRAKGNIQFNGFGLIESINLITQYDKNNEYFTNYEYNFIVFNLLKENEEFNWAWINARRDESISIEGSLKFAPNSWQDWVKKGRSKLSSCRRRVSILHTYKTAQQKPIPGSPEEKILKKIYNHYEGRKHVFESLAATITARVIGRNYQHGWITKGSSDGGADFVGRLDVGNGLACAKIIVLGQAKCESPSTPTGGNHIARTVARLRRGWIGVYVTTSYFSEPVQREVLEDRYPIILINGLKLAEEILVLLNEEGFTNLDEYLKSIDDKHHQNIEAKNPEEILYV